MAYVVKYPTSKYWVAAFRDASGKQHRRSTREVDRKRALAVALAYERVAKGKGSPQRVRQVLSEFMRDHFGQDLPSASVRDFFDRWLAARRAETSPATFRRYGDAVRAFLSFLGPRAASGLDEVTREQITGFRDSLLARLAPATTNGYAKLLRRIFRSARQDGFIIVDPAESVKAVRGAAHRSRRPFSIDELRSILAVADPEWASLIKFGLYTGQRLGDLAALGWAQIDLERDEIALTVRKTGKQLLVPIAAPLREHLLTIESEDNPRGPLHSRAFEIVTTQNGRVGTLSNQFNELLVSAGLRAPQPHRSRGIGRSGKRAGTDLSFHSLRHTAVSLLKDAGVPDAVVMALVGHESAAMSHRYTHVGKESLARAASALPEI